MLKTDTLENKKVLSETVLECPVIDISSDEYWDNVYSKLDFFWCTSCKMNHPISSFSKGHVISHLKRNWTKGECLEAARQRVKVKRFRGDIKINVVLDKDQMSSEEIIKRSLGVVYFVSDKSKVKIGISDNLFSFVGNRFTGLQSSSPNRLYVLGVYQTVDYKKVEKELHEQYKKYHSHGEWFYLVDEIEEYIAQNCFKLIIPNRYFGETHLTTPLILSDDLGF